jgi:hypothetical protein
MRYRTRRTNDIVVGAEGRNLDAVFIATEARYYNLLDVHQGKVFICEAVRPRGGRWQEGKRPIGQRVKDEITQVLYCTVVNGTVQYGSVQYCTVGTKKYNPCDAMATVLGVKNSRVGCVTTMIEVYYFQ